MTTLLEQFRFELQATLDLHQLRRVYFGLGTGLLPGDGHGLYLHRRAEQQAYAVGTMPREFMAGYESRGRADDPVLEVLLQGGRAVTEEAVPLSRWLGSQAGGFLVEQGIRHTLKAPIRRLGGEIIGTLNIARCSGGFTGDDLRLAEWVGREVSVAVHRALRQQSAYRWREAPDPCAEPAIGERLGQLTERELQLVRLIAAGASNAAVAAEAGISVNTVKEHLKRAYAKLGVRNRVELVHRFLDR